MTKPPADDKAMRDARKVVEDHIRACGDERMGVLNPDILKESIAAHFRNYEIAARMLEERIKAGEERTKQLQAELGKAIGAVKLKLAPVNPQHTVAYSDLCALISRHSATLTSIEILAIAANMVGKLVALQDQRTVSPAEAMEIIARNIERGNMEIIGALTETQGNG